MTLHDRHRRELAEESGISADVIDQRGYRSVTADDVRRLGCFAPSQCRAGLLLPLWNTAGVQQGYMLKPDDPRPDKDGKPIKYEYPAGVAPMLDIPPSVAAALRDPSVTLDWTEGSKKADSAATHGLVCGSVNGVYGWMHQKVTLPEFDDIALKGRRCRLIFDSDVTTKPQVRDALDRFAAMLTRRDAKVLIVTLPPGPNGEKVGLDDFLAAGGTVADLDALAAPWRPPTAGVADRDQVSDFGILARMVLDSTISRAELTTYVATYHELKCATPAEPGGPVTVSARRIANDWRGKPEEGGTLPPTNKNGERPRLPAAQVKPILETAMERGLLTFGTQRVLRSPKGRKPYWDTDYTFTPPATFADFAGPRVTWTPDQPKTRKPRARVTPCPHCGKSHPIERVDSCTGCGAMRDYQLIVPEPARGPMGDNLSPIDEGAMSHESPPVVAPSPAPTTVVGDNLSPIATTEPIDLGPAQTALEVASHATGSEGRRARADLSAQLEGIARQRGRDPVHKPTSPATLPNIRPPGQDHGTYPHGGARR